MILVRELIVVFSGNELAAGIILSSWLIWGTTGSLASSRIFAKYASLPARMILLQSMLGLSLPFSLYATRCLKSWVGIPTGHVVALTTTVVFSLVLLMPVSLLGGMLFALGSAIWSQLKPSDRLHALPYSLESLGAATGGLSSLLAIQHLHSFQISALVGATCTLSSLMILYRTSEPVRQRPIVEKIIALLRVRPQQLNAGLLLALILTGAFSDMMEAKSAVAQWFGQDLRFYKNSMYGNVAVTSREEQFTLHVDGIPTHSMPTPDIATIEEIVHIPLLFHSSPQEVLLIGGGVGGTLKEILKHRVASVEYVEFDPLIIQAAELFEEPSELGLSDPRVKISSVDSRFFIAHTTSKYDIVLVNLPSPSTILVNRMYTREFFASVNKILSRGGILSVALMGSSSYLSQEQAYLNACVVMTLKSVFKYVRPVPGDVNLFLASDSLNLDEVTTEVLVTRLNETRLDTALLSEFHIEYRLDPRRYQWFLRSLSQAEDARMNTDLLPSAVFYDLWIWNSQFSEFGTMVYASIKDLSYITFVLPLLVMVSMLVAASRRRFGYQIGLLWMVISTGFCGMTISVVLAVVFQSIFGYLYYIIGLLLATFMFGLFFGSVAMMRVQRSRTTNSRLILIDMTVLGVSLLLCGIVASTYSSGLPIPSFTNGFCIFFVSFLSGVVGGSEFSLANRFIRESGGVRSGLGEGLALLYSCDLAGAWAGALVVSLLLPVFGVVGILLLVATVKATSVVTLLGRKRS